MTRAKLLKAGAVLVVVGGIALGLRAFGVDIRHLTPERVRSYVLSFGALAPVAYLVVYGQPIIPLPASVLTLTGGLAFGPLWGSLAAVAGATIRACGQFLLVRLFGRDAVAPMFKGRVAALDKKINENAFRAVLLVRLIPNVPFDMQNYGFGFSTVKFRPYALATLLGVIPGSFVYVYLGHALTDLRRMWKLLLAVALVIGLLLIQRRLAAASKEPT